MGERVRRGDSRIALNVSGLAILGRLVSRPYTTAPTRVNSDELLRK